MGNFNDILEESLPSHTPLFVECVENDYGFIRVYYEEASDAYTLYIEKSHQTPEEKKNQQELLKKLKYDPKTKTIEVDGHRTRFYIDRENPNMAATPISYLNAKDQRTLKKLYEIDAKGAVKKREYDKAHPGKIEKTTKQLGNKLMASNKGIYDTETKKAGNPNGGGKKVGGVVVGKKNLDEELILHEVGHVRDISNRRRAEAEPSYVAKYGTKELPKDIRKARLELNKLKKKQNPTFMEKRRIQKLEKLVQKGIENTSSYKNDKGQQNKDNIKKMDEDLKKRIERKGKRGKLDKHDRYTGEYYADAYAIKHGSNKGKSLYKGIDRIADEELDRADKQKDYVTASIYRDSKKSSKEREKIARHAYKKHGKTAVESVKEMENIYMRNFNDVLNEPLPSHTPLFVECVENDYGCIRVYYEKASDLYTLYIEKSHQTPEEKKKQQELLKKLNYDPKTKTIEVDGHRTRFEIDREDEDRADTASAPLNSKDVRNMSKLEKLSKKNKLEQAKYDKTHPGERKKIEERLVKKLKSVGNPYETKDRNAGTMRGSGMKIHGISVGKKSLDENTILHEVGHVRETSNRRRAEAEPSYVAKYGTKELPKDVRRARLELNKLNKLEKEFYLQKEERDRKKELEKIVQKGIESTPSYKKDKGQQRRDAIEKMDKNLQCQIRHKNTIGGKLDPHDRYTGEYYADAYAMKHSSDKGKSLYKTLDKKIDKKKEDSKKRGYVSAVEAYDKSKKSTKEREKIAKGVYKKYGKTAVESAN